MLTATHHPIITHSSPPIHHNLPTTTSLRAQRSQVQLAQMDATEKTPLVETPSVIV
jgi:hypothetical protein